jgi:ribosomal-protein-alanine N-acetyltransferase
MNACLKPFEPDFRPMAEADVDRVLAIELEAYAFPWTRGNFMDCLHSGYSCWVVEVADELVGYSILMAGAGEGHVLNCCIAPRWQGRGLGRQAMQRLIEGAPGYGVECLFLEVRPSNVQAINLYESLGFETIGLRRAYYPAAQGREDAVVMRLGPA